MCKSENVIVEISYGSWSAVVFACGDLTFARVKSLECTSIITGVPTIAWLFVRHSGANFVYGVAFSLRYTLKL